MNEDEYEDEYEDNRIDHIEQPDDISELEQQIEKFPEKIKEIYSRKIKEIRRQEKQIQDNEKRIEKQKHEIEKIKKEMGEVKELSEEESGKINDFMQTVIDNLNSGTEGFTKSINQKINAFSYVSFGIMVIILLVILVK